MVTRRGRRRRLPQDGGFSGSGYVNAVGLGTDLEPIGEGPPESTRTLARAMAQRIERQMPLEVPLAPVDELRPADERDER